MLLIGYAEKHKEICQEEDCPLKVKRRKKASKQGGLDQAEEFNQNLIKVIDRIYLNGLKKFPKSAKLRLSYAFFLLEFVKNKLKALEQLNYAFNYTKPAFDQQFLIFRFKKLIQESLDDHDEEKKDHEIDIVDVIAFENHLSQCEEYMVDVPSFLLIHTFIPLP